MSKVKITISYSIYYQSIIGTQDGVIIQGENWILPSPYR